MLSRRQTLMALAAGFASQAYAQRSTTDYPTKPIKIIVPFPAGGGGDILARLTLSKLAQELGQSIVFENIGGAGGNVGVSNGSRAAADGYTLVYGTNCRFVGCTTWPASQVHERIIDRAQEKSWQVFLRLGRQWHHVTFGR